MSIRFPSIPSQMNKLEQKVLNYLNQRGFDITKDTLNYRGVQDNFELPDGTVKKVHSFSFMVSAEDEFENMIYYIFIDAETNRLELLLTPHYCEKIIE